MNIKKSECCVSSVRSTRSVFISILIRFPFHAPPMTTYYSGLMTHFIVIISVLFLFSVFLSLCWLCSCFAFAKSVIEFWVLTHAFTHTFTETLENMHRYTDSTHSISLHIFFWETKWNEEKKNIFRFKKFRLKNTECDSFNSQRKVPQRKTKIKSRKKIHKLPQYSGGVHRIRNWKKKSQKKIT